MLVVYGTTVLHTLRFVSGVLCIFLLWRMRARSYTEGVREMYGMLQVCSGQELQALAIVSRKATLAVPLQHSPWWAKIRLPRSEIKPTNAQRRPPLQAIWCHPTAA